LLGLVIDFSFQLFVLSKQIIILLFDFINSLLICLIFRLKLSLDSIEMVFKSFFDLFALFPFLSGNLLMSSFKLFVLVVVFSS
jgi:hypothetical protein